MRATGKERVNVAKVCGTMTMVVLLYTLSTGPATAWYHRLDKIDMEEWHADNFAKTDRAQTFRVKVTPVYEPLSWLGRRSRGFQRTLESYQCLWTRTDEPFVW